MDLTQLYNTSAMLTNYLRSHANELPPSEERTKFEQLAQEQQNISERLKPQQNT